MARYEVVCVERKPASGHHHVIGVGVVRGDKPLERRSVKNVRKAIKAKADSFYIIDPTSGEKVALKRHKCCGEKTISATAGAHNADNLAALSSCNRLTWYMVR